MKSKFLILSVFLVAACGSEPKKGANTAPPAKPKPTPTATPLPTTTPQTQNPSVVAPPPPQPLPQSGPQMAQEECPTGPVRRWIYNVFHEEDCPPPPDND